MRTFESGIAPHAPPRRSVRQVMGWVLLALLPGVVARTVMSGPGVLIQLLLAIAFALLFEALMLRLRGLAPRPFLTDFSAPLAAALFALCLPPLAPWWIALIGMAAAIVLAKQLYGGLGHNLFNPAMVGYAVVLLCFPLELSRWTSPAAVDGSIGWLESLRVILTGSAPAAGWDAIAEATPLDLARQAAAQHLTLDEIAARQGGDGGQAAAAWLAAAYGAGGLLLISLRIVPWQIPLALLGSVLLIGTPLHLYAADLYPTPAQQLLSGGLVLAAFFIATDPVTGCTTPRGRWLFAAGVAVLTLTIRRWGNYPDGVAFAILLMNCAAPWIDLHSRPRIFGEGRTDR